MKQTSAKMTEQVKYAQKMKAEAEAVKADHIKVAADLKMMTEKATASESWKVKLDDKQKELENLKVDYNKTVHRANGL